MTYNQALTTTLNNYEGLRGFLNAQGNDDFPQDLAQDLREKTAINCTTSSSKPSRVATVVNQIKQNCNKHKLRNRLRKKLEEKKKKEAEELEARKKEEV